jgi:hypothetical protein
MILLKAFGAKMVDAILAPMVAKTQRYERHVVAFAPATCPQMVKLYGSRLMVPVNVVAQGAAQAGDLALVFTF